MNSSPRPDINVYRIGRYTFRTPPPQLYDEGNNTVQLPAATLIILESLLVNRERVVSREELLNAAWPDCIVQPNSLDRAISTLKKQLPADHIETTRAREPITPGGYRYVGPFEQIQDMKAPPQVAELVVTPDGRHRRAWLSFARTIISSYENRSPLEYPYAVRNPDVPLRATLGEGEKPEYHFDAVGLIRKNLRPRAFTFLVGEYGSGKTYLAGALAYHLAKDYVAEPEKGLLPVILPLRQTATLSNLDSLLQSTLFTMYSVVFSLESFVAAHQAGRLVLILDGLDEMIARTDRKDVFFHLSFLLNSGLFTTTPVVLTTRPNIIRSTSYYRRLGAAYTVITVDPLDEGEVKKYLRQLNLHHVVDALETNWGASMGDLLSRPLYVEMIIAAESRIRAATTLDSLTLNRLYDYYFEYWYERELRNLGRPPGDLDSVAIKSVLSQVAQKMSSARKPYISESVLQSIVHAHASAQDATTVNSLFIAAKERLILVPDFAEDEVRFAFRHDSLRSYFHAGEIAHRIERNALTDDDVLGLDPATVDFLFGMAGDDKELAAKLSALCSASATQGTPTAKDVLAFLWERKRKQGALVDTATVAWLCAGDENVRSIVTRSLGGVTFRSGGSFLNTTLSNATFRGSTLQRAVFEGGTIAGADFTMAELSGSRFAHIDMDDIKCDHAGLNGCTLTHINASGARFSDAFLQEASMTECTFVEPAYSNGHDMSSPLAAPGSFVRAKMLGISVQSSRFVRVSFEGADLRTSHFDRCVFEDCSFATALLTGARFEPSCVFRGSDLAEGIQG